MEEGSTPTQNGTVQVSNGQVLKLTAAESPSDASVSSDHHNDVSTFIQVHKASDVSHVRLFYRGVDRGFLSCVQEWTFHPCQDRE